MTVFLWSAGHLGWGVFSLIVFTGLWCLLSDLVWRLVRIRIGWLTIAMLLGWIIGAALVASGFLAFGG